MAMVVLWSSVGFAVMLLAAAALAFMRAVRTRRELSAQVGRMNDELMRTLADPLLVHQARRRLRQSGGRRPEAA